MPKKTLLRKDYEHGDIDVMDYFMKLNEFIIQYMMINKLIFTLLTHILFYYKYYFLLRKRVIKFVTTKKKLLQKWMALKVLRVFPKKK